MGTLILQIQCEAPMPLQQYLRGQAGISAHMIKQLKRIPDGITRNGSLLRTIDPVSNGDTVVLHLPEHCDHTPNPALHVPVTYESVHLAVCNKPTGMPVHPSMLHRTDTLANWFAAQYPDCGFHALNRLDRNTSGLCLIAKDAYAAHKLCRAVEKTYYALVPPGLTGSGTIDAPIAREQESVITRCVRADGQHAVTHYRVIAESPQCTLLACTLETGRTHQIRVHMAHIGYPLLGDSLYGGDCTLLQTQALHCGALSFTEPETGELIRLTIPLRQDMHRILKGETI